MLTRPVSARTAARSAVRLLAVVIAACLASSTLVACGGGSAHAHGHTAVPAPDTMTAYDDAVRVLARAPGCRGDGGAGLTDGTFVLTAASAVAGATSVSVVNRHGRTVVGRVIAFDGDQDVAWLYAPGLPTRPTQPAQPGDRVAPAYLFAFGSSGKPLIYRAGTIVRTTKSGPNVFGAGRIARNVYVLTLDRAAATDLRGAPVLDQDGRLLGITLQASPGDRSAIVLAGDAVATSSATRTLAGIAAAPAQAGTVVTHCGSGVAVG